MVFVLWKIKMRSSARTKGSIVRAVRTLRVPLDVEQHLDAHAQMQLQSLDKAINEASGV